MSLQYQEHICINGLGKGVHLQPTDVAAIIIDVSRMLCCVERWALSVLPCRCLLRQAILNQRIRLLLELLDDILHK